MSWYSPAAKPKSLLGYYRLLSPTAAVRVSPLCLGTMNFGENWTKDLGECNKETTFEILDHFYDQGGNFIDTANHYQDEQTEIWLGEWMKKHDNRDEIVLATKFTTGYRTKGAHEKIKANFQGNHAKSLKLSVEASLKKLQTSYLDLLYVHWWDFTTSVEELMNSLHREVLSGRVLYLGISDTPAWIVVKCNDYARQHGLTQFSVYQGHWSAAFRDVEREILPMCQAEGMGIAPWGSLGRGMFKSAEEYNAPDREGRKSRAQPESYVQVTKKLDLLAKAKETTITSVALAYVRHKAPYVFPIVGGRKLHHLQGNIEGLGVELTDAEIDNIESAVFFDPGFPLSFAFGTRPDNPYSSRMNSTNIGLVTTTTPLEVVPSVRPIEPRQGEKNLKLS